MVVGAAFFVVRRGMTDGFAQRLVASGRLRGGGGHIEGDIDLGRVRVVTEGLEVRCEPGEIICADRKKC